MSGGNFIFCTRFKESAGNVGQNGRTLFVVLGGVFGPNSSRASSFWVGLFALRILHHVQVVAHMGCSRGSHRKNAGGFKVLHMEGNYDFVRFGGIFWIHIWCSLLINTLEHSLQNILKNIPHIL